MISFKGLFTSSLIRGQSGIRKLSNQVLPPLPTWKTTYGGRATVTLIPGDGVGKELTTLVKTLFKTANMPIDWEEIEVSGYKEDESQVKLAIESLKRNRVGFKGILYTPVSKAQHSSFNVKIRKELDLYACVVKVKSVEGLNTRHKNVDYVVIRENTEGEYSGLEHQSYPGVVESLKVVSREKSERIAQFAFDYAVAHKRKKVTCIHKANIMKLGDGLFLNSCRSVSQRYEGSGIKVDDMIVDNAAMQLVSKPQQFDVVVLPNLYGNIVTNIGAALIGSPGILPGYSLGPNHIIFEPGARHVGKDIEGKNSANPTSMVLSSCLLLRHLGLEDPADKISNAVHQVYKEAKVLTPDLGGTSTTSEFCKAILKNMDKTFS